MDEKKFREVLEDCWQEMGVNYQATKHQEQALFYVFVEKKDTFVIYQQAVEKAEYSN